MAWQNTLLAKVRAMDWFRGLRAATAICGPILLGYFLRKPEMAWAGLGGFEAIISDRGGPYRSRIAMLGTLALGGTGGLLLGSLIGDHLALAVAATVLWCFAWSYLMVMGQPFSSASPLVQLIYLCGLGAPASSFTAAAVNAGYLLGGCAWAMLLSLFLWPVDPYRPARFAVGDCYEGLAAFLKSIHDLNQRRQHKAALWHRLERQHQRRMRALLEAGRFAVTSVRSQSSAETVRGRNLIVLLESADLLLARTIALADYMETTATEVDSPCTLRAKRGLLAMAEAEVWIGNVLRRRLSDLESMGRTLHSRLQRIPAEMSQCLDPSDERGRFLVHQINDAEQNLEAALESAVAVRLGRESRPREKMRVRPRNWLPLQHEVDRLQQLVGNWNRESLLLRHAARVAVVCGIGVCIMAYWHIDHGYWIPLTSVIVLQPHVSGTFRKSLQRIGGTVSGGILAAVLSIYLHTELALAVVLFPLAFFSLAVLPVSYVLFSFFLTPTFILAFLPHIGDWQVAVVRIMDTVLGALIAMAAMATMWPSLERRRFGKQLQRSLEANRKYVIALAQHWASYDRPATGEGHRTLAMARRATGLAHNDSEDALDRLVIEPPLRGRASTHSMEAAIAFVTYLRRFGQSITSLASIPGAAEWKQSREVTERLSAVEASIVRLEQAIGEPRAGPGQRVRPKPYPKLDPGPDAGPGLDRDVDGDRDEQSHPAPSAYPSSADGATDDAISSPRHHGQRQLARLERQLGILWRGFDAMQGGGLLAPSEEPKAQIAAGLKETQHR